MTWRSRANSELRTSATSRPKSIEMDSNSKSMRADPGSMFPPVTLASKSRQITADNACRAVWVRINMCLRSQSITASTFMPAVKFPPSIR